MLTTGYWPAYPPAPLKIPRELLEHLEAFEKFYLSKHQGRRLTWQVSLRLLTLSALCSQAHGQVGRGRRTLGQRTARGLV